MTHAVQQEFREEANEWWYLQRGQILYCEWMNMYEQVNEWISECESKTLKCFPGLSKSDGYFQYKLVCFWLAELIEFHLELLSSYPHFKPADFPQWVIKLFENCVMKEIWPDQSGSISPHNSKQKTHWGNEFHWNEPNTVGNYDKDRLDNDTV